MRKHKVPGVSVVILQKGRIAFSKGYGEIRANSGIPIDSTTMFSVGSLSKTTTAAVALRLVDAGKFELDNDIQEYLKRWSIPDSPKLQHGESVTIRRILSHTAGTSVHGFADFQPGEALPDSVQILNGASPAKNRPIRIVHKPGRRFDYSGGGFQILQLAIEDVTNQDFPMVARSRVFAPLGLKRSTFQNPLPEDVGNIAHAHDHEGRPVALPRGWEAFPEEAASGLWTTPSDYADLLVAITDSARKGGREFLSRRLAREMFTPVAPSEHGLGPDLSGSGRDLRIHHGGSNQSYKSRYEYYPNRGEGVIVFTNGANGSALIKEIRNSVSDLLSWPE